MPRRKKILIRPYQSADREDVRHISVSTAMMGSPSSLFFDGDEVMADALTRYFTDFEPQSAFVAEVDGRVVGYIIGAKDTAVADRILSQKILLPLVWKGIWQGIFLKAKNWALFYQFLCMIFSGGWKTPDFYLKYPATLHINILDGFRELGVGSDLMRAYLGYLKQEGVKSVRMATMSDKAAGFFKKNGFTLLHAGTRSYFRHVINRNVPVYIYGKDFRAC